MHANITTKEAAAGRLIEAAQGLLVRAGRAGASGRAIAAEAQVAPSLVAHHFGTIEQLLLTACDRGLERAENWMAGQLAAIRTLPATPETSAFALEQVIRQWTGAARTLALLYQEALMVAPGDGIGARWSASFTAFWLEVAAHFGLGEVEGRLMGLLFESEALHHLSTWSPALEDLALRAYCEHFSAVWLGAAPGRFGDAVVAAERMAGALPHGGVAPAAVKIVEAAADVLEARGVSGLTHRAVAARAGVTTGSVTHHFRTIEDLMAGAIRGQVALAEAERAGSGAAMIDRMPDASALKAVLVDYAVANPFSGPAFRRRLAFLAALRRPELAAAGAVIRFAYGGTLRTGLRALFPGDETTLVVHAGVAARLLASVGYVTALDEAPDEARTRLAGVVVDRLFAALERAG